MILTLIVWANEKDLPCRGNVVDREAPELKSWTEQAEKEGGEEKLVWKKRNPNGPH